MNSQPDAHSLHSLVRQAAAFAIGKVLPGPAINRHLSLDRAGSILTVAGRQYRLDRFKRILVVGGGKAARLTGAALSELLGDRITAGALCVYQEQARAPWDRKIALYAAGHPLPNEEGAMGGRRIAELLGSADAETLVMALISGGGSSLMAVPAAGITLDDYCRVNRLLLTVPATIDEINAVRKHIDLLKGGGMRKLAAGAGAFVTLALSDVPVTTTGIGDDPSVIASGPTVGDESTFQTACDVLKRHGIWEKAPVSVRDYILANIGREENETLAMDSPLLSSDRSQYVIIADNDQAMAAAKEFAESRGFTAHLAGAKIKDEVGVEVEKILGTVSPHLLDGDRLTFAAFSTDGVDGSSDLAGAIADRETLKRAAAMGLDYRSYLSRFDSASFFSRLGLGIATGPTGTNVADIVLVLITNPADAGRKAAFIFGGEPTVNIDLPPGTEPGVGGRNTHLALLAAERLARRG